MGSVSHLENCLFSNKKNQTTFNYLCQYYILECCFHLTQVILTKWSYKVLPFALMLNTWKMSG